MDDEGWAKAEVLLRDWLRRAREGQHSHYEAGKFFRRANYWLAVPVVLITTTLGTAAFASVAAETGDGGKIWFGALSMLAAALATLQTHFRYAEKAEKHKTLGAEYGNIRRRVEALLSLPLSQRGQQREVLDEIRNQFDAISAEGDVVSRRIFRRTERRLARRDRDRTTTSSTSA